MLHLKIIHPEAEAQRQMPAIIQKKLRELGLAIGREGDTTEVLMQARREPGRFAALCGMVGIMICTAVWCWWRKEERA